MPLEWRKDAGSLLWVRNPFTGAVTYFTDVHKKRSGFPPPLAAPPGNDSEPHSVASLETIRRSCPFCPGNEAMTTAELLRVTSSEVEESTAAGGWLIRAFHNLVPRIPERCTGDRNESYVVVEDPRHFVDEPNDRDDLLYSGLLSEHQTRAVLRVDIAMARLAYENPAVKAVLVRKNQGPQSGASQPHVHNQVIGFDRPLPPVWQEHQRLVEEPDLWWRIVDLVRDEGFLIEERDGCFLYFCPFGTFPRSYEIVCPDIRSRLTDLDTPQLEIFTALLHRVLATLGPTPLDYEIHDGSSVPLHAHINARHFAYSNIGGTLNLPVGLAAGTWQFPPTSGREPRRKRD